MGHREDIELAERLGLPRPRFDGDANPGIAECWGDRVRQVGSLRRDGRADTEAVREVLVYGGNTFPRRDGPVPMTRTVPAAEPGDEARVHGP